uniref:Putative secreted protein n=1 Tax=Ixodes ricinus TaxID=34613 RepID=A0A6B0U4H7_IXORI
MAVTMLAACALNPPTLPAMAEPIKFFVMFTSTKAWVFVLRTSFTTLAGIVASQTTLFPRPSIQFSAAGFLSVQ